MEQTVRLTDVLNRGKISDFQYGVFVLCAGVVFVEGFDTQAIGYVAPALSKAWALRPGALGPVFAAGLIGLLIGSLLIAPLADRVGRRPIILWSTLSFGLLTLITPLADSLSSLLVLRFVTGLGLGGAMPNVISLCAEYAPERRCASIVAIMFCGFGLGSACGGLIAVNLLSSHGWQAVFFAGGALTLVLFPLFWALLPESVRFLAHRGTEDRKVARILARIDHRFDEIEAIHLSLGEETRTLAVSVRDLFRDGRGAVTALLWVIFFMGLFDLYWLAFWLPTTINAMGIAVDLAVIAAALMQIGGIAGALILGRVVDRFGPYIVLPLAYLLAAVCIVGIGYAAGSVLVTMVAVFGAGFGVVGSQNCNNAVAAKFYPTGIRSTGVGWANGIGRSGSIIGPTVGGMLLAHNMDIRNIFIASAAPALCACIAYLTMGWRNAGAGADPHVAASNTDVTRQSE
jgi:AAHS family 4-hydroxybenzoate transporter-like MFS transporter